MDGRNPWFLGRRAASQGSRRGGSRWRKFSICREGNWLTSGMGLCRRRAISSIGLGLAHGRCDAKMDIHNLPFANAIVPGEPSLMRQVNTKALAKSLELNASFRTSRQKGEHYRLHFCSRIVEPRFGSILRGRADQLVSWHRRLSCGIGRPGHRN
jgi:hypothetical protein